MDSVLSLYWRLAGRVFAPYMASLPDGLGRIEAEGWISMTGEPIGSLNMAFVEDGPGAVLYLAGIADLVEATRLPMVILMSPALAARISSVAMSLGFRASSELPLMAAHRATRVAPRMETDRYRVTRVERDDERMSALRVQSETFRMPLASLERIYPTAFIRAPGFDLFLATRDGESFSTVVTTTISGVTGLWSMATPPARQRQGAGRAAFEAAIAYHESCGIDRFFLGASPAGEPLYAKSGFLTVATAAVWEAGPA